MYNKLDMDINKVLKWKVLDSEKEFGFSIVKFLKCKLMKLSLEFVNCKFYNGSKLMEIDCKDVVKGEGWLFLKVFIVFLGWLVDLVF